MKQSLRHRGVILEGHFKLTSGRHSASYINKDSIYCKPNLFRSVFMQFVMSIKKYQDKIDIITGPAIAGAILALPVAMNLEKIFIYPEKYEGTMILRRGYDKIVKNKNVWIIEDIITTGRSVENTIDAITFNDGNVLGVSCIWNRADYSPSIGEFLPLINEQVFSYLPKDCPQCKENIPLQDPKQL